jgi:hypothetical protein
MENSRVKKNGINMFSEYVYAVQGAGLSGTVTDWCVGGADFVS